MDYKEQRFHNAIALLTPGNRDANLSRVVAYGVVAGLAPSCIFDAIMQGAPGDTRPDPNAVRHALDTSRASPQKSRSRYDSRFQWTRKTAAEKLEDFRRSLPEDVRQSVSRMVAAGRGATPDDLIMRSPTPVPLEPRDQAAAHLRAIGADWRWQTWVGTISRDGDRVCKRGIIASPACVAWALESRLCPKVPTHVTLNPLTGEEGVTKDGKPSYDCEATVAALRFMLVEFDHMSLNDQLALWTYVVKHLRDEVPLVSIVFSGSKSLHGVVLCPPKDRADLAREGISQSDRDRYLAAWDKLMRRFASSQNSAERMDLAPSKNVAIHTRVAGARREESGKHQKLLYLDTDLARRNLELF